MEITGTRTWFITPPLASGLGTSRGSNLPVGRIRAISGSVRLYVFTSSSVVVG